MLVLHHDLRMAVARSIVRAWERAGYLYNDCRELPAPGFRGKEPCWAISWIARALHSGVRYSLVDGVPRAVAGGATYLRAAAAAKLRGSAALDDGAVIASSL